MVMSVGNTYKMSFLVCRLFYTGSSGSLSYKKLLNPFCRNIYKSKWKSSLDMARESNNVKFMYNCIV